MMQVERWAVSISISGFWFIWLALLTGGFLLV